MYAKVSKSLQSLLAHTAFEVVKHHPTADPATRLLIALLSEKGTIAREVVRSLVGEERTETLLQRISHTEEPLTAECGENEIFFLSLEGRLCRRFYDEPTITSAHLLIHLLEQPETPCSPLFFDEGVTPASLYRRLLFFEEVPLPALKVLKERPRDLEPIFRARPKKEVDLEVVN